MGNLTRLPSGLIAGALEEEEEEEDMARSGREGA
jgi:hypothetical protein